MKNYLKILFNSRYIFFINFIEKLVYFLFFLVLARELNKSSYGLITAAFAFCNIAHAFFDMGLSYYIQREAENKDINSQISGAFSYKAAGSLLYIGIVLAYLYGWLHIDAKIILVIGGLTYLHGFNTILISFLYGKKEYKKGFLSFLISRTGFFIFIGIMLLLNVTGYYILLTLLLSAAAQFVVLMIYVSEKGLRLRPDFTKATAVKIIKSSLPIGIGGIFVLLYDKVDVLLIERFINLESVAIYAIAYSVYKLFHIFSSIILTSVYTDFSRSYLTSGSIKLKEIKSVFTLLGVSALIFIAATALLGDKFVILVFGVKYSDSVKYLYYLILALPALYLNNFTGVISNSARKEKIPMFTTGIGALINILSNLLFIYSFGIWGAVIATVLTEYSVFILQAVLLVKENKKIRFIIQ